jgi:hypothetical protein
MKREFLRNGEFNELINLLNNVLLTVVVVVVVLKNVNWFIPLGE